MFFFRTPCGRLPRRLTVCASSCAFRGLDVWMKSLLNLLHTEAHVSSAPFFKAACTRPDDFCLVALREKGANTETSRLNAGSRGQRLRKKGWSGRAAFSKKAFHDCICRWAFRIVWSGEISSGEDFIVVCAKRMRTSLGGRTPSLWRIFLGRRWSCAYGV